MFETNSTNSSRPHPASHALKQAVLLLFCCLMATASQAEPCTPESARVISVQGNVDLRQGDSGIWHPVTPEQTLCPGATVRVQAQSRAALYLSNGTIMRLDQLTTVTLPAANSDNSTWLNLLEGVAHFISRIKQNFEVTTPFVNAAVEGTEFVVAVNEQQTDITVFEGHVRASNGQGEQHLTDGQSARTLANQPPVIRLLLQPRDAVQWALYYPPITEQTQFDFSNLPEPWPQQLAQSLTHYQQGDLTAALAILQPLPDDLANTDLYIYRAALLLGVGQPDQASLDLQKAPNNGNAIALQAIIALVNNHSEQALTLAQQAVTNSPEGIAPYLALSYAQQARFNIEAALQAAQQAAVRGPNSALTQARIAELYLAQGQRSEAVSAAQSAVKLNPTLGRAQSVLGFTHLTTTQIPQAQQRFQQAIALDQIDPLPRMGLGLAMIRSGQLEEGRRQIEYAASLDPNNAIIRSYLGKAYYEERRDTLAETQLGMAKMLDPNDPTPWLYDAMLKQGSNRPVQALQALQTSIELNDNRAVYRSRLLLDGDQAARSASLAKIYQDLGFNRAALLQGWSSLNSDPGNAAAHRLLADAYANTPRHEIARVSELLQAQLLQPINIVPVSPQATEGTLAGSESAGIALAGLNEYSPLFTRDGAALRLSGTVGNNNTVGDEIVVSGIQGRLSYSLGQFHSSSDGARENSDYQQNAYNLFAQYSVTEKLSAQFEYREKNSSNGDLQQLFDTTVFDIDLRDRVDSETSRLGFHYTFDSSQDVIGSVIYGDKSGERQAGLNSVANSNGLLTELQHIWRVSTMKTVAGLGYFDQRVNERLSISLPGGLVFPVSDFTGDIKHKNSYLYSYFSLTDSINMTVGGSYENFDYQTQGQSGSFKRSQVSPKIGVLWQAGHDTSFRLAVFRALKRPLLSNQTIEPTQVSGFNQFFDDSNAADSKTVGVGFDSSISEKLSVGTEILKRRLENYSYSSSFNVITSEERSELINRLYVYWTLRDTLGLSVEYRREYFGRPIDVAKSNNVLPYEVTTHYLPLSFSYTDPNGLFGRWTSSYIYQDINFDPLLEKDESKFWMSSMAVGYRLKKYSGMISGRIDNPMDKQFNFQSVNFGTGMALPPTYPSARQFVFELRLWFR